jgi:hypothetical protein
MIGAEMPKVLGTQAVGVPMQPSQLGRIILTTNSSSGDEMHARAEETYEELDELLAEASARAAGTPGRDDQPPCRLLPPD